MAAAKKVTGLEALVCGGCAGFAVDVSLYPIDTLKTRLQSGSFFASGGFRGVYRGLSAAAAGSVPGAALFFGVYETAKKQVPDSSKGHVVAASLGEVAACLIRVPVEVIKQRLQAGQYATLRQGIFHVWQTDGFSGFFRGYGSTVLREIPFAAMQMPLLEASKSYWSAKLRRQLEPYEVAGCGSVCGGLAAACTTPLDVIKTRLMLGQDLKGNPYDKGFLECAARILRHEGPNAFFAGLSARVFWISLGGFVFFGAYDAATSLSSSTFSSSSSSSAS